MKPKDCSHKNEDLNGWNVVHFSIMLLNGRLSSQWKENQEQAVHHQGIEHFCDHLFNQWKQHVINRNMSQILKKNF